MQHLIAATAIDVSLHRAVAEGRQFTGKLVWRAISFIITAANQRVSLPRALTLRPPAGVKAAVSGRTVQSSPR